MKNYAIILASGTGRRFGGDTPKQFMEINGKTVLEKCVETFEQNNNIDEIIVVIHPDFKEKTAKLTDGLKKVKKIVEGGKTRKESSYNGVFSITDEEANVFIHDCARPFVSQKIINDCALALKTYEAVTPAIPVTDTIIEVSDGFVQKIPQRENLMKNQTPQCFRLSLIKKGHKLNKDATDDCSLVETLTQIRVIAGDEKNIKITYASDITRQQ